MTRPDGGGSSALGGDFAKFWPMFRGPAAGRAIAAEYPLTWDAAAGTGVLWKAAVPLQGHNSPIVWGGRLYLTGADAKQRVVYCFDALTGKPLWQRPVEIAASAKQPPPSVQQDTGFAAPTMATDGQRFFAIFANGDVAAFDADGKQVWTKALGSPENTYGMASSLAVYKTTLIIQLDQGSDATEKKSALIGLDTVTGKTLWRTVRPVRDSWSSPIVVNTGQRDEVITCADPLVIAYDPATGAELWRTECLSGDVAPSPAYGNGLVIVAFEGTGIRAIRPPAPGKGNKGEIVWQGDDGLPDTASPAANDDFLFTATSAGMVTCYDTKTGKKAWEKDVGEGVNSSPVILGDRLYVTDIQGGTHILKIGAQAPDKPLGVGKLGEPVRATLAFVDGRIYIRGEKTLYCIGTAPPAK